MFSAAFHRPLRRATVAWILCGCMLAAVSAVLAFAKVSARDGVAYTVVAVVLAAAAVAVGRGVRWVTALILVVFAGQIFAVVGIVVELVYGIAPTKAAQLHQLGFDPTVGVATNLVLSAAAFSVFVWFRLRYLRLRRARTAPAVRRPDPAEPARGPVR